MSGVLFSSQTILAMILGVIGCGLMQRIFSKYRRLGHISESFINSPWEALWLTIVLFYSILLLANNTYNPFIYFRF